VRGVWRDAAGVRRRGRRRSAGDEVVRGEGAKRRGEWELEGEGQRGRARRRRDGDGIFFFRFGFAVARARSEDFAATATRRRCCREKGDDKNDVGWAGLDWTTAGGSMGRVGPIQADVEPADS
jgi:hypothetical protein